MTERTALYRLFGATDELLYVGITNDTDVRWKAHGYRKPWWSEVASKTVEWFDDRRAAATAEARAIREELPRWNIAQPDENDPLRGAGGVGGGGRPATGQTKIMGFRPPRDIRDEFEALAKNEGRTPSDALIEAMHDWVKKKRRDKPAAPDG